MDEAGKKKLWDEYLKSHSPETREKIILEYAPLVKLVAGRLSMYLGYNVEYEDLVSYGIFGLIDAIDKFDSLKEVKFETYASLRIRGAILDQLSLFFAGLFSVKTSTPVYSITGINCSYHLRFSSNFCSLLLTSGLSAP